jgi:hypothetical protein
MPFPALATRGGANGSNGVIASPGCSWPLLPNIQRHLPHRVPRGGSDDEAGHQRGMASMQSHPHHVLTLSAVRVLLCRYDLHVLLVEHGKRCPSCSRGSSPRSAKRGTAEHPGGCPLASLARSPGTAGRGGASKHPSPQPPDNLLSAPTSPARLKRNQQAGVDGRLGGKHRRISTG